MSWKKSLKIKKKNGASEREFDLYNSLSSKIDSCFNTKRQSRADLSSSPLFFCPKLEHVKKKPISGSVKFLRLFFTLKHVENIINIIFHFEGNSSR